MQAKENKRKTKTSQQLVYFGLLEGDYDILILWLLSNFFNTYFLFTSALMSFDTLASSCDVSVRLHSGSLCVS